MKKWRKHYSSGHKILLVSEGDFSFAASLAAAFGDASNIVATSLHSQEVLARKHSTAAANLVELEERGCTIIHGVDACTMSNRRRRLRRIQFDRIVFNFPHVGITTSEHDSYQILLHQQLVRGFLRNAYKILADGGEVHITHKTSYPFTEWKIEEIGEEAGFVLAEEARFMRRDYPGYVNKKGYGPKSNKTFPVGECSTFKFAKKTWPGRLLRIVVSSRSGPLFSRASILGPNSYSGEFSFGVQI